MSLIYNLKSSLQWWRGLAKNPVYIRERGGWGKPNPYFDNLSRFLPFLILGAMIMALCAGVSNPALFAGDESIFIIQCLLCLPGILLATLTLLGAFMAPALTAPSISQELDQGTWDILRLTPQSTGSILLAKLLGGLSRLRIWPIMFALTMLQAAIIICGFTFTEAYLTAVLIGMTVITRPWLEVLFAGFLGMYISTCLRSTTMALAVSYTGLIMFRFFNSTLLWLAFFGALQIIGLNYFNLSIGAAVASTAVYFGATTALCVGLVYRAERMEAFEI